MKKEVETFEEVKGPFTRIPIPKTFDDLAHHTEKDMNLMSFVATSIAHEHMIYLDVKVNAFRRIKILNTGFDGKYLWVALVYEKPNGIGTTLGRLCAVK